MNHRASVVTAICMLILAVPASSVTSLAEADAIDSNPVILDMVERVNESMVLYYLDSLMSFGPRYTGSENCSAAAQWIHNEFTAMGLDTHFDTWSYAGFSSQNVVATLKSSCPPITTAPRALSAPTTTARALRP